MEKLGIIGTGYMARIIAQRAKELGIETHCYSIDDHSVAAEAVDYCHHVDILDLDALTEACRSCGVNGVVATTELTIYPAAVVAAALGLNGNDPQVAKEITDKNIIREKVKHVAELSQPQYWICKEETVPEITRYPVIVKPIAAGGKRGITVVYAADAMEQALRDALANSKVEGALVEEFLAGGTEYSVESLSFHGNHHIIQVTQKDSSGPPHCVELGHHQPAPLSTEMRAKVERAVAGALEAAGIQNGPCHTEIKIIDDKVYLIEINGRPGGDHIAYPLTELSTGYPYITGIITAALDRLDESAMTQFQHHYSGVLFVTKQTAYLKEIFDHCDNEPWLYRKNHVSDELQELLHNDGFNLNYIMYYSQTERPAFTCGKSES